MNVIMKLVGIYLNMLNTVSVKVGGKHAFHIFCYTFKAKLTKEQQTFLDTAHRFKLSVDDKQIQCYRWGNGPKNILFVHGWQSHSYRWKKYIEELPQDQFTIYSLDAPGHGNSEEKISTVPLFEKALQAISEHIGELHSIVSHSIGSFSSLYFVDQNPEKQPKKLVTLATPNSIEDFLDYYFKKLNLSEKTVQNFRSYFTQYTNKETSYFTLSEIIKSNKAEGLIIHDEEDSTVAVDYSMKLHTLWPKSKLVITQGLGHKLREISIVNMVGNFVLSE
ncbi:MAG: pimeloyl-ACP methyl ester carboxylesterase [Halioglobus sp.]|jgi:pimeloyl-ACP methyl ester carboxylesterase